MQSASASVGVLQLERNSMRTLKHKGGDDIGNGNDGGSSQSSDEEEAIGPQPLPSLSMPTAGGPAQYGKALLPGEGAGMAQFVQNNLRVPRRGEIGIDSDKISRLEQEGYVMSGSRHARMNAVRMRKENQVYTTEEKRALAVLALEERQKKELEIVSSFRADLQKQLKGSDGDK